jgi:hypothetical protein
VLIVSDPGATATLFKVPDATTTSVVVVVTIVCESCAWIVSVYVPGGVVPEVVVMFSVDVGVLLLTGFGLKLAVVPAGKPEITEKVIAGSKVVNAPWSPAPFAVAV